MSEATVRIRVQFADADGSRRIHFAAMFRYMEVAEHELMRSLGLPYATAPELEGVAFPRVHVSWDFRGPILFDDELDVSARIARVGTSSWTVAFTARNLRPPQSPVVAEGEMVIVAMDPHSERSTPLPDELRATLQGALER